MTRRDSTDGEDPLGLTWNWPSAALGAVYALPAAGVAFLDVRLGIALAVGVLPAAIVGLPPARRARLAVLVLGVVTAVSMFLGGALAGTPVVAVAAIALLAVASALLAARSRAGEIAMTLSLPLCAAALMVMRPVPQMQRLRSVGRILAVAVGAVTAIAFVRLSPPAAAYSAAAVASVAAAAATHASRWYVTAAFTTFLVFLLLLFADPDTAGSRFGERVGETLLGVGLAYVFGLALPALAQRRERIKA